MIINRTILRSVIQCIDEYPVTLITGARQVGKTTIASHFEKTMGFRYVSFDDETLLEEAKSNPQAFLERYGTPLIIDEVQKAKCLFQAIEKRVNDVRRIKGSQASNGMYILTGSQKYNLMGDVSESMSGRVGIVEVPPLSQAEIRGWDEKCFIVDFAEMNDKCDKRSMSDDELYDSIIRGFYPARWEIPGKPIKNYYANYVSTYLERDVSQLISLRDKSKFENLLRLLASLTGEEYVPDNIAKTLGVDKNTINAWVSIIATGDIISLLEPYHENSISKRIVKRSKLYFNDTGLACHLLGIDTPKTLMMSTFKGRMVETYVHNEIKKSYLNNNEKPKMFFYRDSNQNEIDFILQHDGKIDLIECKSGKLFDASDVNGFRQLTKTSYEIAGRCLLCLTPEPYRLLSGVHAFPIKSI